MNAYQQFLGKPFYLIIGTLCALDLVSFLTLHGMWEPWLLLLVGLATAWMAWKQPLWLLALTFGELASTSNGHSLNISVAGISVGVRMVLFLALVLATALHLSRTRENPVPTRWRPWLLCMLLSIGSSLLIGLLRYDVQTVYADANGYLAFGYFLMVWTWLTNSYGRRLIVQGLTAGIAWIALKTLLFVGLFGHVLPWHLDWLYTWIRDTRLGEITLIGGNIYRIFLQSQLFLIPGIFVCWMSMLYAEGKRLSWSRMGLLLCSAAMVASLSRSFWLALAIVGTISILLAFFQRPATLVLRAMGDAALVVVSSIAILWILVALPIVHTPGHSLFGSILTKRATETSDMAIDSRQLLLHPMLERIQEQPLGGSGLGTQVTYTTRDPRYIESHGTDRVTTYAFEWGWLDLWMKFGLIGVLLWIWLFAGLAQELWLHAKRYPAQRWLAYALLYSIGTLALVHFFSPYLNHPLGIGLIALAWLLIRPQDDLALAIPSDQVEEALPAVVPQLQPGVYTE